ncbi:hypothetical protein GCK32_018248 [Trichostrongylus colubriformis]|uniref:Uncharacterized protein n=1 Tax=Trichostrongylus colubriformis TaxID=6319 RepID=A0AAN8ICV1_TRICO
MSDPHRTSRGYSGIDFKSACQDSLRFMVMEQIVYQFKGGTGTPYVYVRPRVEFKAVDGKGNFEFDALADFDAEDVESATVTHVKFSIAQKHILLLTSR